MALASAKQLLDELMGRDRDLNLAEKKNDFTWDGPDICKHFLVKFCPHDLFVNTKADLGACSKIHDERLKKEYEKSSRFQKMGYEEDFLRFCQSMLSDVDKRIRRAKQRLALSSQHAAESQTPQPPKNDQEEKIHVLTERINGLLVQVENLGCEGKVEEAQGIMKLCDQLKDERESLRKQAEQTHWLQTAEIAAAQEKQMEVCDVCGAFLIVGDAQQRVDDHLQGKQHVGYARLKEALEELLSSREKERSDRERLREKDREERRRVKEEDDHNKKAVEDERRREVEKQRGRDRDKRRSRSRENRRSRSHGRRSNRRSRSKERSKREKDRHKHRSRSKERKHVRSRSRDTGRHGHKNNSHSPSSKREKDHKKDREVNKEHRRHSHENGEPNIHRKTSEDKGHSIAGDSDH